MLAFPEKGIKRSVNEHNCDLDVFCDWVEANVLFDEDTISKIDIVDFLIEEQIYNSQDMAKVFLDNVWGELQQRQYLLGSHNPYTIKGLHIKRNGEWKSFPAYSFCILLCLNKLYAVWARQFRRDTNEQGELFELLVYESLSKQFPDWKIILTGWSKTHPQKLVNIVKAVANYLGEIPDDKNLNRWTKPDMKDAGLDLLCYRPFQDSRVGIPVYLTQCASGANYEDKFHTPNLNIWTKIVQFTVKPNKAFVTPYAFLEVDFIRNCVLVGGILIDRYRILAANKNNKNWISSQVEKRIEIWSKKRIKKLPRIK